MMWVSYVTKENKQDEKRVAELQSAWKWTMTKKGSPTQKIPLIEYQWKIE
jgi:hypothetical protein